MHAHTHKTGFLKQTATPIYASPVVAQECWQQRSPSALGHAAMHGQVDSLKILLCMPDVRAQINNVDFYGMSPLHHACFARDTACMNILINAGAICSPNTKMKNVIWPVQYVQHFLPTTPMNMEPEALRAFLCLRSHGYA